MTVRLKDRELQKKLDEISGGDFSQKLQEKSSYSLSFDLVEVAFSRKKGKTTRWFTATFRSAEIEEVPKYDPHAWNEWPEVDPPKMVAMRLELKDGSRGTKALFDGNWRQFGTGTPLDYLDNVWCRSLRFRPWGDPDDKEEEEAERAGGTD